MSRRTPMLTNEQVRTQYCVIPDGAIQMFLEASFAQLVRDERSHAKAEGDTFDVIGWPDGTTVFWTRPASESIDLDQLSRMYKLARRARDRGEEGVNGYGH